MDMASSSTKFLSLYRKMKIPGLTYCTCSFAKGLDPAISAAGEIHEQMEGIVRDVPKTENVRQY